MISRDQLKQALGIEEFGGAPALARHIGAIALTHLGRYRTLRTLHWPQVRRLIFVCKGNICRSPYAEARALHLGIRAASFGLDTTPGSNADASAIRNAAARGLDLVAHRARLLGRNDLQPGDLAIGFEPWHLHDMRKMAPVYSAHITLAGLWSKPIRPDICDPHGRSDRYFQSCYGIIDNALTHIASQLPVEARPP